jgi:hypothetical protein
MQKASIGKSVTAVQGLMSGVGMDHSHIEMKTDICTSHGWNRIYASGNE